MSVNPNEPSVVQPEVPPQPSTVPAGDQPALFKKAQGDWNKANKSYFDLVGELQRVQSVAQGAEQLMQQNQELRTALAAIAGGNGGQPVNDDPWAAVQNEIGLPVEPLKKGTRAEVMSVLEELFGPVMAEHKADETLSSEIENFDQLKGEARKYMKENPEVAEVFTAVRQVNPAAAWKYAIKESLIARGGKPPSAPDTRHAGLPGGMGGGGRIAPNPDGVPRETREAEALKYAYEYGNNAPYLKERFSGTSVQRAVREAMRRAGLAPPEEGEHNIPGW